MGDQEYTKVVVMKPRPGSQRAQVPQLGMSTLRAKWIPKSPSTEDIPWRVSEVSVKLGLPVKIAPCQEVQPELPFNNEIVSLVVNTDASGSGFGTTDADPRRLVGDYMVMRVDGQDLGGNLLASILSFLGLTVSMATGPQFVLLPSGQQETMRAKIRSKLTPGDFANFFEAFRKDQIEAGDKSFVAMECPVNAGTVPQQICALCGADKGKEGGEVLCCSRCKGTHYCGRDCQKTHWKWHKKSCKAEVTA